MHEGSGKGRLGDPPGDTTTATGGTQHATSIPTNPEHGGHDVRELTATPWRVHDSEAVTAGIGRMVRAMPGFVRVIVGLAWRSSPGATVVVVALQVVSAALTAFALVGLAQTLTRIVTGSQLAERLPAAVPTLALVAGCYALAGLANAGMAAAQSRLSPGVRRRAEEDLVVAATDSELISFDDPDFYDALVRARDRGVGSLDRAVVQLVQLFATMISILAMGAVVGVLHPLLLVAMAMSIVPSGWATVRSARLGYAMVLNTMPTRRRLGQLRDLLTGREPAAEVRAYTAEPFLLAEYRGVADSLEHTEVRLGWRQAWIELVGRILSGLGMLLAYGILVWLVAAGGLAVASAGAAVLAMQAGRGALTRAAYMMNLLYENSLYVRDFGNFRQDAKARLRPNPSLAAPAEPQVVDVVNVSFRYPGAVSDVLRGVSLTIQCGQIVALVGENGSGKSTLAKLLAGLYPPSGGAIAWDGIDLAEADADTVRARVSFVLQQPTNWPLTAEQNIRIGGPYGSGLDHARLAEAAFASGAADVITALPAGWDTLLSKEFKGGVELSTGQWQRVAMARALYRDAPLLICDEPTAPLDARAEAQVYDTLRRLAGHRTIVLITHRLATARLADQIVVLHHGKLIERGNHQSLMSANGHYAELYTLQGRLTTAEYSHLSS